MCLRSIQGLKNAAKTGLKGVVCPAEAYRPRDIYPQAAATLFIYSPVSHKKVEERQSRGNE